MATTDYQPTSARFLHESHISTSTRQQAQDRPSCSPSTFRLSTFGLLFIFRLSTLGLLLIFNFSLLTFNSCGLDVEDPTPPSPPIWVQKSLPEEWPERGIDAHESGGIYLEWEPNLDKQILSYSIYRAKYFPLNDSLGESALISVSENEYSPNMEYIDTDVAIGYYYSYKLKAMAVSENYSTFSESQKYSLLKQIGLHRMAPNGVQDTLNTRRLLAWSSDLEIEMENYCLTILTADGQVMLRIMLSPTNYLGGAEAFVIPQTVIFESSQVYKWRIETAARYDNGLELLGSESPWAIFFYVES